MELLVRIVDKPRSGHPELDCGRTAAGDVLAYAPDGHIWGKREVENPDWRIIRVPGMSRTEAEALVGRELPTAFGETRLLRKRQMRLDLEAIELPSERTATPRGVDAVVPLGQAKAAMRLKERLNRLEIARQAVRR